MKSTTLVLGGLVLSFVASGCVAAWDEGYDEKPTNESSLAKKNRTTSDSAKDSGKTFGALVEIDCENPDTGFAAVDWMFISMCYANYGYDIVGKKLLAQYLTSVTVDLSPGGSIRGGGDYSHGRAMFTVIVKRDPQSETYGEWYVRRLGLENLHWPPKDACTPPFAYRAFRRKDAYINLAECRQSGFDYDIYFDEAPTKLHDCEGFKKDKTYGKLIKEAQKSMYGGATVYQDCQNVLIVDPNADGGGRIRWLS